MPLEVWVQRPDASGARTPPNLEKSGLHDDDDDDDGGGLDGLDDGEEGASSISLSLKDSLGSLSRRIHERTPPESPREEGAKEPSSIAVSAVGSGSSGGAGSGGVLLRLPPLVGGRSRSASVGDDIRTPPESPPASPPMARSISPPPGRMMMASSSESASTPNSPFRWGERLLISPDTGRPQQPIAPSLRIRPEPRFHLIDSSSSDMTASGPHMMEIGFERSEKALGQGAFGKVWLGLRDNGEFLAIKEIQLAQGEKYAERLEAVENEIELMRNLDHPHIVRYLGSRRDLARGAFYILLEYVSCGSIQALLKTMGGPLDERVIRKYSRQILLGLAYLHSRDPPVAHRDIKSANVLVETTGNVKLADFGCSKVFSDLLEGSVAYNSVLGTPHWMAPEVIRQEGAGLAADIWSFGCTVVEMATGQPPWSHIRDPTAVMFHVASSTELPLIPEGLSESGKDFLRQCFQRNPGKRPTAAELLLHPFVSSEYVATASLRDIQNSEEYFNSLVTQSLSTMPQFLSVLPANLVVYIFQFLPLADLCAVSAVCRHWRSAAAADALWEVKAKSDWRWLESSKGNRWRDVYVQGKNEVRNPWKGNGKMALDTLRGHGKAVCCIEANGDRLVTGGEDKKIRIWSVSKRKCVTTLRGHTKSVVSLRIAGELVLSGGAEGAVRLWELGKGKCLKVLEGAPANKGGVSCVDMLSTGHSGASAGSDGVVRFWDLDAGVTTVTAQNVTAVNAVRLDGPNRSIWGCSDGSLRIYDARQKTEAGHMTGHTDSVTSVALGRRDLGREGPFNAHDLMASASADGTVRLWDIRMAAKSYCTLSTGTDESLCAVDFDGMVVACAGKGRVLHLFDLASEEPVRTLKQHHSDVIHGVSVGVDRIFSCSRDKTVRVLTSAKAGGGKSVSRAFSTARPFTRLSEMFTGSSSE